MIYFLIPIFNEEQNLELLHENLSKVLPNENKFYVFSNDGSTDNSVTLLKKLFRNESFEVLGDGTNNGPGFAFNSGFEWILKQCDVNNDFIVTLEADNTSDLSILPDMLVISRLGYDLVLSSIYAQGGGFDKTSLLRKVLSAIANLIMRFVFNIKVLTLSSFYRIYKASLIQSIKNSESKIINESGFLCKIELLIKAIKQHARIIEVPMVLYSNKRKGKSKMKLFKTSLIYLRFMLFRK